MGVSGSAGGATARGGGGGARGTVEPAVEVACFATGVRADLTIGCTGAAGVECPGRG